MIERGAQLAKFHRILNTDDGKELMDDLRIAWGSANVFNSDIAIMSFNAALLEAFRVLEAYQNAEELQR